MVADGPAETVRLRPLAEADLAIFEGDYSSRDGAGEYQWFGFSPPGRGLAEMGALDASGGRLTAMVEDRVIGSVFWFRKEYGPPETSWCWEIALHVRKDERGRGLGTQATRLVSGYLFSHTRAHRLQALTDTKNHVMQAVLAKCGYTHEGTLRSAQWREAAWHDYRVYSLLRSDGGY
ncbi:MAG: GNAT family N-acetyltransferase [Trebonia sp.]